MLHDLEKAKTTNMINLKENEFLKNENERLLHEQLFFF